MTVPHYFDNAEQALCWAAEVELATIEDLELLKNPPKFRLKRHHSISASLVEACRMHALVEALKDEGSFRPRYLRLRDALMERAKEIAAKRKGAEPTEDVLMSEWVYCDQHLRPHMSGWCTVGVRNKKPLQALSEEKAYEEVRRNGWKIYDEKEE